MKLYKLKSSNFEAFFGTPVEPIKRDVITIAQTPSCDAFLYLSNETYDELELLNSVPAGFDFTYCQEWGLTVDDDVIDRVIIDLRKEEKAVTGKQKLKDLGLDDEEIKALTGK